MKYAVLMFTGVIALLVNNYSSVQVAVLVSLIKMV